MIISVLGDAKLVEAFELIGVGGHVPLEGEDVAAYVCGLARHHDAGLVLVQSEFMSSLPDELVESLARGFGCAVVEVPGVNRAPPDASVFQRRIQSAMGAAM